MQHGSKSNHEPSAKPAPRRSMQGALGLLLAASLGVVAAVGLTRLFESHPQPEAVVASQVQASDKQPQPAETAGHTAEPQEASATTPTVAASAAPARDVSFESRDGSIVFTVPEPGDPEYEDYQEMLAHNRSAFSNSPGYVLPYDPEWRSEISCRRQVAKRPVHLEAGVSSMEELADSFLRALGERDEPGLMQLRITSHEFETILWPEFPQSRPYLRIPPLEAWTFHHARSLGGLYEALRLHGGDALELEGIRYGERTRYTNFDLYEGVVMRVRDVEDESLHDLTVMPVVVSCNGRYKAYIYDED